MRILCREIIYLNAFWIMESLTRELSQLCTRNQHLMRTLERETQLFPWIFDVRVNCRKHFKLSIKAIQSHRRPRFSSRFAIASIAHRWANDEWVSDSFAVINVTSTHMHTIDCCAAFNCYSPGAISHEHTENQSECEQGRLPAFVQINRKTRFG